MENHHSWVNHQTRWWKGNICIFRSYLHSTSHARSSVWSSFHVKGRLFWPPRPWFSALNKPKQDAMAMPCSNRVLLPWSIKTRQVEKLAKPVESGDLKGAVLRLYHTIHFGTHFGEEAWLFFILVLKIQLYRIPSTFVDKTPCAVLLQICNHLSLLNTGHPKSW